MNNVFKFGLDYR